LKEECNDKRLPELSLVIPAYNEEAAIGNIVSAATEILPHCACLWEIIVVSDCSTDSTAIIAEAAGGRVIEHPLNQGYGNALKTGISNARYNTVAIIDADGSYSPEDLLLLATHASGFDMIVGQRSGMHFSGGPIKKAGRWLQRFLVEFTTGTKIPDVNSGLRIFPRDAALGFFDTLCGGFSFTTSITLAMLMCGYTIKFVPVTYVDRIGRSHVNYFRDTLRSLQIITHAILKFNPIKAFLPISFILLILLAISAPLAIAAVILNYPLIALWFGITGTLCLMTALLVFALGLVATAVFVAHPATGMADKRIP
jgi:glycosyltransferase involved in cell wall biosynthesis